MTWIRDNIVKIAIILGILIIIIIIFAIIPGGGNGDNAVKATGYQELENKLQSAAINFVNDNPKFLPSESENTSTIKYSTLQKNKYIGSMYAVDDSNVKCDGEVVISTISSTNKKYRFLPYIKCGKYYTTTTINDYIINNETIVNSGDGLYKEGDYYRYKGEYPNNYILLDGKEYRIISILPDGNMKLIKTDGTKSRYIWDDRYNSATGKTSGITKYEKSRMKDNLNYLYSNEDETEGEVLFTEAEKNYFNLHDFCNNDLIAGDNTISIENECKAIVKQRIGFINASDYYLASIDSGCSSMNKPDCSNYNYLNYFYPLVLMNLTNRNNYQYLYMNNGIIYREDAYKGSALYIVTHISGDNIYRSGNGTKKDPYVLR